MPSTQSDESGGSASPRVARLLSGTCLLLALALPASALCYLSFSPVDVVTEKLSVPAVQIAAWQRVALVLSGMVPVLCMAFGLLRARSCFQSFRRGEYFTLDVVRGLRGLAVGVFLSGVSGLLAQPLASVLLALTAAPGLRSITFSLDSTQLLTMLFAGLVWQISAVMAKAVVLAEENSQFV